MKYEIKKLSTSKFFILLLICLLANLFFCYTGIPELPAGKEEMDRYLALYINDYESFEAAYRSLGPIDDGIDPSRLPSDAYCMKTIAEQAMYLSQYREELSATLFQAEVNLSRLDPHTFMYRYQSQIWRSIQGLPSSRWRSARSEAGIFSLNIIPRTSYPLSSSYSPPSFYS